jgi:chromatin remodeling complex protein RSC6
MTDYRNIQDIDALHLIIEKLSLDKEKLKKKLIQSKEEKDNLKETLIKYKKENKKHTKKIPKSPFVHSSVQISDEFADFTSLERGSVINRPRMVKLIMDYIKNHHLLDQETKQIIPDTSLKNLLKIHDDEKIFFHNIHKYVFAHLTPIQEKAYSYTLYDDGRCTAVHEWGDY